MTQLKNDIVEAAEKLLSRSSLVYVGIHHYCLFCSGDGLSHSADCEWAQLESLVRELDNDE